MSYAIVDRSGGPVRVVYGGQIPDAPASSSLSLGLEDEQGRINWLEWEPAESEIPETYQRELPAALAGRALREVATTIDGSLVVARDGTNVSLVDAVSGAVTWTGTLGSAPVAVSANGERVVSVHEGTIIVRERSGAVVRTIALPRGEYVAISADFRGHRVAVVDARSSVVRVFQVDSAAQVAALHVSGLAQANGIALDALGSRVALYTSNGVAVHETTGGTELQFAEVDAYAPPNGFREIRWSLDNRAVVGFDGSGVVVIETGARSSVHRFDMPNVVDFSISADGRILAVLGSDGNVSIFDTSARSVLFEGHAEVYDGRIALTLDSSRAVVFGDEGAFEIARIVVPSEVPPLRSRATLVALPEYGSAFLLGGEDALGNSVADAWMFNVYTMRWSFLSPQVMSGGIVGASVYRDGEFLYLLGGHRVASGAATLIGDLWRIDLRRASASLVATLPPVESAAFAVSANAAKVYMVGGQDASGASRGGLRSFDMYSGEISELSLGACENCPEALRGGLLEFVPGTQDLVHRWAQGHHGMLLEPWLWRSTTNEWTPLAH